MFQDEDLKQYLQSSSTIKSKSVILGEWNLNQASNILKIGNYRYRPSEGISSKYGTILNSFDPNDEGGFYTDATSADVVIDGGYTNQNVPVTFTSKKQKEESLYSLEDCFNRFRPRSGINKARYFSEKFLHHTNTEMARRPRYYMSSKDDNFKYWSSYRTEVGIERGISKSNSNGKNYIDDAAPFVVYKTPVPANRIIVKMQTNVGDIDLGPFTTDSGSISDPLYGDENKTTPSDWKIQVLEDNNWIDAVSFDSTSLQENGLPVIGPDGYVEIAYGLLIPEKYKDYFLLMGEYRLSNLLPSTHQEGHAYLVGSSENYAGDVYVSVNGEYESFSASYGWDLVTTANPLLHKTVTKFTGADSFIAPENSKLYYREFKNIQGVRVIAETMSNVNSSLDIIEISPRLVSDLTDRTMNFSVNKIASDLGVSGMPVGQLLASTGAITLFDYDLAFNPNNTQSILSKDMLKNIQIKIYEIILDAYGYDYYVPIKTMYSDGFPESNNANRTIGLSLRDLFFYFESMTAPQIIVENASVSYVVSMLLDSIGFSNYKFLKNSGESEVIIPHFFISPDKSIAEVLQDIAISTQTAMFFDEYNNFIMMSRGYMMPTESERETDIVLQGSIDSDNNGILRNDTSNNELANIIEIQSQDNDVYNAGNIKYTSRYIQRSYGSIRQASLLDKDKTWIYKPALLWEVSGSQDTKSINDEIGNQSTYVLAAMPLNSDLDDQVPQVVNNTLVNNIIDFGEGIYWITRYNGFFYSNGEVIKYDAVEYSISDYGNVWINNVQEYQNYFSKLSFGGKIYPSGRVRIYSEPNYEEIDGITRLKNGPVAKHGRGQFATIITKHVAGLDSYWTSNQNIRGCSMSSSYIFNDTDSYPETTTGPAGVNNVLATKTTRSSVIKNFLSNTYISEQDLNNVSNTSVKTGTIQSSALVMNGPPFSTTENPVDFISYVHKPLNSSFRHFGTRARIIGKIENSDTRGQTPIGSTQYYSIPDASPNQSITVNGGSGGLGILLNPETNNGYYFEIIALAENNLNSYSGNTSVQNIIFYKIVKDAGSDKAIPIKLWSGLSNIVVDDGRFTGQSRVVGEEFSTVYDMAVEYQDFGSSRRFYLYLNNKIIATVNDDSPLPVYNNMALFVRGSSRLMFENIYALSNNYSQNTSFAINTPITAAIDDREISANESFRKYAMSGIVQSTYLSGISPQQPPSFSMYFEEFGSIMREAAYMKIRYDKAYPALYAKISPTYSNVKGYTVSGFQAGAYGAEFIIFNSTDTALSLDESTGNYLRIQGVTFTQESNHELSVDEYFSKNSDFSNPNIGTSGGIVESPLKVKKDYEDIKNSRITYGKKEFSISAPYIQTQDDANDLMGWIISKTMKPRKSIGLKIFGLPTLQLGDIVKVNYSDSENVDVISKDSRFVVYNISTSRSFEGPQTEVFLSEVI